MIKTKVINIDSQSFTLKELTMRQVRNLFHSGKADQAPWIDRIQALMTLACPELTMEVLLDLPPSDIETLWEAFKEVNITFLGVVRLTGLLETLVEAIKTAIRAEISKAIQLLETASIEPSASSSSPATVPLSGTTATLSS
jgi:hypothetical protein